MMLTKEILKEAFKKLLAYSYYDKTDMLLRKHVAEFALSIRRKPDEEHAFEQLLQVGNGEDNETFGSWLGQMKMAYYPKKLAEQRDKDSHLITNIPPESIVVERLLIKADIPVELLILDVAWVLLYGYKADADLRKCCWGNRIDLNANHSAVRKGDALFKKYQTQYSSWWRQGLNRANERLRNNHDVAIVSFDIKNCYHSVDFSFDTFLTDYESLHPEDDVRDNTLTGVIEQIYNRYWDIVHDCGEEAFQDVNEGKRPLPLSLMSAHILANWYLKPLDKYIEETYHPLYYGRYVDDCMVVMESQSSTEDWIVGVEELLPGLLDLSEEDSHFAFAANAIDGDEVNRLATLQLQRDKVYLYRFDCELPPTSLQQFEDSQLERSSEYRFMTDDADAGAVNLSTTTLVDALDAVEESGRRFNILEENKYRLAVYLAKLSSRLAKFGREYDRFDEVKKLFGYFKGSLLIKHYMLWERILSVFVLAGEKDYARRFSEAVTEQINGIGIKDGLFAINADEGIVRLKETLLFHLHESMTMALSLHPEDSPIDKVYLSTMMVRMHHNIYPMQEFAKGFETDGVRLPMEKLDYANSKLRYRWVPYYVKYYDVVSFMSIGQPYDPTVFERAFALYLKLNHLPNYIGASAFCHIVNAAEGVSEFNTQLSVQPDFHRDEGLTVAVVNMDLDDKEGKEQIEKFGAFNKDKALTAQTILDKVTEIETTDLFLMPEMTLPIYELREYMLYASQREIAFVAGLEYFVKKNTVYNHTITCLPITLFGRRDAVPVIRLKNHYAPAERVNIIKHKKKVPQNLLAYQNLYHWHDHVFTSYYCYELTSIKERSYFFSQIDAMYCPVFNLDTYYFNNIAESMARDMHCYFALANVSHLGDSRVTAPMKHDRMNLLKVKGGNTKGNKAVVLTALLDIDKLRTFQVLSEEDQKDNGAFKQTPPDYIKENVGLRQRKFVLSMENPIDDFIAGLNRMALEY